MTAWVLRGTIFIFTVRYIVLHVLLIFVRTEWGKVLSYIARRTEINEWCNDRICFFFLWKWALNVFPAAHAYISTYRPSQLSVYVHYYDACVAEYSNNIICEFLSAKLRRCYVELGRNGCSTSRCVLLARFAFHARRVEIQKYSIGERSTPSECIIIIYNNHRYFNILVF